MKVLLDKTVTIREMLFQQLNIARVPVFRFVVHFKRLEIGLNRMEEITNGKVYFRPRKLSLRPFLNVKIVVELQLYRLAVVAGIARNLRPTNFARVWIEMARAGTPIGGDLRPISRNWASMIW